MQVISIFIAVLTVSRLAIAQSQSGYNYPSPFNPLTPGSAPGDVANVPGQNLQQSTPFTGSQHGFNNQPYPPAGPPSGPSFGVTPSLTPGFNQPQFGQPTASSLPTSGSHSNIPGHSSGAFVPSSSSQSGFPSTSAPSSKGFESSGFPVHSGGHSGSHLGNHLGSIPNSLPGISGTSFQGASSFPGLAAESSSSGFGGPVFGNQGIQGQQSFGGQANFGPSSGGNAQFQNENDGSYPGGDYSAIPGIAGVDYPIYTEIPKTSFDCKNQQFPGYYADVETQCQVFHICALNKTFNFLCPNGTIFSQEYLVCVWWNQFDCNTATSLFGNNAYIYDYSKTGQPQADNQGPSRNFGPAEVGGNGIGFDGPQGPAFGVQGGLPGFGTTQPGASFGPSVAPGFGQSSGFGPTAAAATSFTSPSQSNFSPSHSGAPGFGSHSSESAAIAYPGASPAVAPSTGFGQPSPHSPGFGQSHIPSSGSSHPSTHGVSSSHSFPSQTGAEQYPIGPSSQPDYQNPSGISPTIPSSPAPFGVSSGPTGYPAAGTPSPINTALNGDQPSREYLPSRGTN